MTLHNHIPSHAEICGILRYLAKCIVSLIACELNKIGCFCGSLLSRGSLVRVQHGSPLNLVINHLAILGFLTFLDFGLSWPVSLSKKQVQPGYCVFQIAFGNDVVPNCLPNAGFLPALPLRDSHPAHHLCLMPSAYCGSCLNRRCGNPVERPVTPRAIFTMKSLTCWVR